MYYSIPYDGPISLYEVKQFFSTLSSDNLSTREISDKFGLFKEDRFSEFRGKFDGLDGLVSFYNCVNYDNIGDEYLIDEHREYHSVPSDRGGTVSYTDFKPINGVNTQIAYWHIYNDAYVPICKVPSQYFTIYLGVNIYNHFKHEYRHLLTIGDASSGGGGFELWSYPDLYIWIRHNNRMFNTGLRNNYIDELWYQPLIVTVSSLGLELHLHNQIFTLNSSNTKIDGWCPNSSSYYNFTSMTSNLTGTDIKLCTDVYSVGVWSKVLSEVERRNLSFVYRYDNGISSSVDIEDDIFRYYNFNNKVIYSNDDYTHHEKYDYIHLGQLTKYGSFTPGQFDEGGHDMYYDANTIYDGTDNNFSISVNFRKPLNTEMMELNRGYDEVIFNIGNCIGDDYYGNLDSTTNGPCLMITILNGVYKLQIKGGAINGFVDILSDLSIYSNSHKFNFTFINNVSTGKAYAYLDGILKHSWDISNTHFYKLRGFLSLGAFIWNSADSVGDNGILCHFYGQIYDFMLWKKALTSNEVAHLYERSNGNNKHYTNTIVQYSNLDTINDFKHYLKHYYYFDYIATNNYAYDSVSNGYYSGLKKYGALYIDHHGEDVKTMKIDSKHHEGMRFDGSGGFYSNVEDSNTVEFLSSLNLDNTDLIKVNLRGASISLWIKIITFSDSQYIFHLNPDFSTVGSNDTVLMITKNTSTNKYELKLNSYTNSIETTILINSNFTSTSWHHIIITANNDVKTTTIGKETKVYMDGVLINTTEINANLITGVLYLGSDIKCSTGKIYPTSHESDLIGCIDEFAIWSRLLLQTDVTRLYNGGSGYYYDKFN